MAPHHAPVAKLDKASVYETEDCWFESSRVRQWNVGNAVAARPMEWPS